MPNKSKLVKRTVTEEVYEAADVENEIDTDEDDQDGVEDEKDDNEQPRRKRHR